MVFCICGKIETGDSDFGSRGIGKTKTDLKPPENGPPVEVHPIDYKESIASPTSKRFQINESIINETATPGTPTKWTRVPPTGTQLFTSDDVSLGECSGLNGFPSMIPLTPSSDFPKDLVSAERSVMGDEQHANSDSSSVDLLYIDEFGSAPEDQFNTATAVPFFSKCSSTMGYPTARLLQFRLSGIMSIPESPRRANLDSGL